MPAFDLSGKLGLDGSDFSKTLQKKKTEAGAFTRELGSKFKEVGGSFVSGFLGIAGFSAVTGFFRDITSQAKEVSSLSKELNITAEEAQLLQRQAESLNISVHELIDNGNKLEEVLGGFRNNPELPSIISNEQIKGVNRFTAAWEKLTAAFRSGVVGKIDDAFDPIKGFRNVLSTMFGPVGLLADTLARGSSPGEIDTKEADRLKAERERQKIETERKTEAEQIAEIEKRTAELNERTRVSKLTTEEKRLEILEKIKEVTMRINAAALTGDKVGTANAQLRLAELNARLPKKVKESAAAELEQAGPDRLQQVREQINSSLGGGGADRLTRVGGFSGREGKGAPQLRALQNMEKELKEIKQQVQLGASAVSRDIGI